MDDLSHKGHESPSGQPVNGSAGEARQQRQGTATTVPPNTMDEWQIAKHGLVLFLNNEPQRAEDFLKEYIDSSVHVMTSYTFINCINGVISYELEKMETAQRMLKDLEQRCSTNNASWFQSFRSMLFGGGATTAGHHPRTIVERLDEQIILADSQLCSAILTFLTQDMSGMMRGCWSLKKAWKIYQSAYKQIYELYRDSVGEEDLLHLNFLPQINASAIRHSNSSVYSNSDWSITSNASSTDSTNNPSSRRGIVQSVSDFFLSGDSTTGAAPTTKKKKWRRKSKNQMPRSKSAGQSMTATADSSTVSEKIDPEVVKRLHGAICFGYGVFQLSVSLLPPSMLKLVSFFGFEGDREMGLACLKLCRRTTDMRSPLATVALLWYHSMGTQIFGGEKENWDAEIQEVSTILRECEVEFAESALFVFFKGRLERMQKKMPEAIERFERAYYTSALPELRLLCLHEIGWCRLIQLDCLNAIDEFHALQINSDYTKSFFIYLTTLCHGVAEKQEALLGLKEEALAAISSGAQKESPIDQFLVQRLQLLPSTEEGMHKLDPVFWRYLVYELLFLWNALDTCSSDTLDKIISDCDLPQAHGHREAIPGLTKLILGCCLAYRGNVGAAQRAYRDCLNRRQACDDEPTPQFTHVSAFASYRLAILLISHFGERDEAHTLLLNAQQKYKGYDFESRLSLRIHTAIKELAM